MPDQPQETGETADDVPMLSRRQMSEHLQRATVEWWENDSGDDDDRYDGEIVDVVRIGDHWHFVAVRNG